MTLDEAIKALVDEYFIEDFIYNIRDRVGDDPEKWGDHKGNSWEHPAVKRYAEACAVLKKFAKNV